MNNAKILESRATGKKRTLEFNSKKWGEKRYLRGLLIINVQVRYLDVLIWYDIDGPYTYISQKTPYCGIKTTKLKEFFFQLKNRHEDGKKAPTQAGIQ